jgi:hypothetical protein
MLTFVVIIHMIVEYTNLLYLDFLLGIIFVVRVLLGAGGMTVLRDYLVFCSAISRI